MPHKKIVLAGIFPLIVVLLLSCVSPARARSGEVVLKVTVDAPAGNSDTRLWLPYPSSDGFQTIEDVRVEGNFTSGGVYRRGGKGNAVLYSEWTRPVKDRYLVLRFRASARERSAAAAIPAEAGDFLMGGSGPVDEKVLQTALSVTKGKVTVREKARALYDWVVQNLRRDPDVRGCGLGDVTAALARRGGKCADISGVYVALLRAAGIPARKVYGLRLGRKEREDITGGYHCWAEFYEAPYGWVPADPSDAVKLGMAKGLRSGGAGGYRDYYFGTVDEYRVVLARGGRRALTPALKDGPPSYFMYPYAEVDGRGLEWLAAQKRLKFKITFRALD